MGQVWRKVPYNHILEATIQIFMPCVPSSSSFLISYAIFINFPGSAPADLRVSAGLTQNLPNSLAISKENHQNPGSRGAKFRSFPRASPPWPMPSRLSRPWSAQPPSHHYAWGTRDVATAETRSIAQSNLSQVDRRALGIHGVACGLWVPMSESKHSYPLVICYIAIENGHRNSEFSHKTHGDFQ